jgi:hypothetical protein
MRFVYTRSRRGTIAPATRGWPAGRRVDEFDGLGERATEDAGLLLGDGNRSVLSP